MLNIVYLSSVLERDANTDFQTASEIKEPADKHAHNEQKTGQSKNTLPENKYRLFLN